MCDAHENEARVIDEFKKFQFNLNIRIIMQRCNIVFNIFKFDLNIRIITQRYNIVFKILYRICVRRHSLRPPYVWHTALLLAASRHRLHDDTN